MRFSNLHWINFRWILDPCYPDAHFFPMASLLISCPYCSTTFYSIDRLVSHIRKRHSIGISRAAGNNRERGDGRSFTLDQNVADLQHHVHGNSPVTGERMHADRMKRDYANPS